MSKSRFLFWAALVASALVLASCVTMKDPWIGQTKEQVVATYGDPKGKSPYGHGGEVWVYLETVYVMTYVMTYHGPSDEMTEYLLVRQFWFDANGVAINHRDSQQ